MTTPSPDTPATDPLWTRIAASFARQGLMTTLGARLVAVSPGSVTIEVPVTPAVSQQQGLAHGGLPFAIGDSAAGYAALSLLGDADEVVTSEIGIHYLAPARGSRLRATGSVLKPGKRMLVAQADVFSLEPGGERHVARLSGTMVRVPAVPAS